MGWDAIGAIGEIVGAIAVVATLGYLAAQVTQSKRTTQAQMVQAATEQLNQVNLLIASDPSWAQIMALGGGDSLDSFSLEQRTRYFFLELSVCRALETLYFHHLNGDVEPRIWEPQENALKALAASPVWQQWWREQPMKFSSEFAAFVDELIEAAAREGYVERWTGITGSIPDAVS